MAIDKAAEEQKICNKKIRELMKATMNRPMTKAESKELDQLVDRLLKAQHTNKT